MGEFLAALAQHSFLQYALAAGLLASVACGVVGSYVRARGMTYMAGGIAHCVLGGMGAARYLHVVWGWEWLSPLMGAVVAALAAALIIGIASLKWKEAEDTLISAVWSIGMAAGVLFIWGTPGYHENLMSYLFGNILMVGPRDLWLLLLLNVVVVGLGLGFYNQLTAICFDEEFATLRNVPVTAYYLGLLCLTALTVVLLTTVVGLVMVIALLTLPVAVAGRLSRALWQVMALAAILTAALTSCGLFTGYATDLPAGAITVILAGATYLAAVGAGAAAGRLRRRRSPAV